MIDCIIPMLNEKKRVGKVLQGLLQVKNIKKIVCVDDGSSDGSYQYVKNEYPEVYVVKLNKNRGKSEAVKEGTRHCESTSVLLFDADYYGFDPKIIEQGISEYEKQQIGMLVFRHADTPKIYQITKTNLVISGMRILRVKDLKAVFKEKLFGYQLELGINDYFQSHNRKIRWMNLGGEHVLKSKKRTRIVAIKQAWRMFKDTIDYRGLWWYLKLFVVNDWKEWNDKQN